VERCLEREVLAACREGVDHVLNRLGEKAMLGRAVRAQESSGII
jgi:hypothetical protein